MAEREFLRGLRVGETRKRELGRLVLSFVGILLLSYHLSGVLGRGWETRGVPWNLFYGGSRAIGVGIDAVVVFLVGLFVGLLALMWVDEYKRGQAFLLTLGTAIGFAVLFQQGQFEGVDWGAAVGSGIAGAVLGAVLGGGTEFGQEPPRRFPGATRGVFWFITAIVVVGVVEFHVRYTSPLRFEDGLPYVYQLESVTFVGTGLLTNLVAGGLVIFLVLTFTRYENREDFVVLGPRRSGKTTMMTGLLATVQEKRQREGRQGVAGNSQLNRRVNQLSRADEGFGEVDTPTEPGDAIPLELNYEHGSIFPQHVFVRTLDYAGERVDSDLVDAVKARIDEITGVVPFASALATPFVRLRRIDYPFPEETLSNLGKGGVQEELSYLISDADTILLIIPLDEYVEGSVPAHRLPDYYDGPEEREGNYTTVYRDIVAAYREAGVDKDVILVATMADLAKEHFEETRDAFVEDWDVFRQFITEELLGGMGMNPLKNIASNDYVYPVYFEPNPEKPVTDDGSMNPKLRGNRVEVRGADELLDALGRE